MIDETVKLLLSSGLCMKPETDATDLLYDCVHQRSQSILFGFSVGRTQWQGRD